ncbi:MAG: phenylacetate-CoA ligase [Rhodothermales bacterium]|jgi:phenylacetate-CoA ligase
MRASDNSQLSALQSLLGAVIPANPFYTTKFGGNGVGVGDIDSLDAFHRLVPFTTKRELVSDQRSRPPYGSNLTYPVPRYTRFCQTSGTSGAPMRWLDTQESWSWMLRNWQRVYKAADVTSDDRVFFAFSFGPFLGFWTAFEAAVERGCLCLPGGGLGSVARARMILDNHVSVICCTPTYAIHLAESAIAGGVDLSDSAVRRIIVAGEPGGSIPATRQRIQSLWPGARVVDHHGMTEVGPVSYEPRDMSGYLRIIDDAYHAEIIEPGGEQAVEPGQAGELVLTTLGREACPLIRYRTGDIVRADPDAEGTLLVGGILARADDMIIVRGVNIFPSAVEAVLRSFPEIAEYQVEIDERDTMFNLTIAIEPVADSATPALCDAVANALNSTLSLRVPVRLAEDLPRFELKAKRWIRI